MQNFRPPVVKRLGLDYETLRSHGFDPVYVSISGYGADGPYADHPATDSVMQADSGLMHTNRDEQNMPQRVGVLLADIATGVYAAQACTAALLHRFRFGTGTHVEINLFNVCCALQSTAISEEVIAGQIDKQAASAPNGVFEAADGKIAVLALSNDHFLRISEALGLPHWRTDPRFATNELRLQHKAELHADLVAALRRHTVAELEALFQQHSVLHARVRTANDVVHHPQAQHLSTFLSMKQPDFGDVLLAATPWPRAHLAPPAAPRAGEHSARILADLGLSSHEIESLAERRIIGL
ncbi:Acetyl-CoA:oxalate CoA-transferase [bioreactor metagenome]|uniref:Acetyl-CoA:oxalate CoA-transferase n=1 Tax=bioreactor metagenome TaxID=1076179 RepID=A0A645CWJ1_9ZZZZ